MKAALFLVLLLVLPCYLYAQQSPTFKVSTDKQIYLPGDSLTWQCELDGWGQQFNAVTLQLWAEHIRTGQKWEFRFPVINGYAEGAMLIGKDLPPGRYAFNFLIQPDFFNISGKLSRPRTRDTVLNYFVLFKGRETMLEKVKVARDGSFNINGLVYPDTAMFTFSRIDKGAEAPAIRIATSLDSDFTPAIPVVTSFVNIVGESGGKDTNSVADISRSKDYKFDLNSIKRLQLSEVIIKDKRRTAKLLKDYQNEYVSAQFRTADDITIDGLSNNDMQNSGSIYNYLMMHVPGLTAVMNPETGAQEIQWRNTTPTLYIDEFRLPDGVPITIMPGDVAMIKVFRPGSGPLTGGNSSGSAIAIYTKVGRYSSFLPAPDQQNRFYIRGYNARSMTWVY
jgi:hypothetical protein